jgi:molecular chaperone HtpG
LELAEKDPKRLKKLIQLHYLSIKALAAEDEEFFLIFVNWLPFETNMGTMTLTEYRQENETIHYAPGLDQFRQVARVAASQSLCVINAAYTYDLQLLLKLREVFPDVRFREVDGNSLSHTFEHLTLDEQDEIASFVKFAEKILQPYSCLVEVRKFSPEDLPALYTASEEASFRRTIERTKEVTDSFWSSVLDNLDEGLTDDADGRLCFNYRNPAINKVCRMDDEALLQFCVQVLYVQALMLGHRPLNSKEMKLFNEGLMGLVAWGADLIVDGIQ